MNAVLRIRIRIQIRLDPFHFGQPDPGSKKSVKIMETFHKNQPKPYIFFKTIKLMFTDVKICPINNITDHISEKYIFNRKKSKTKVDIFPILGLNRIRIHYFTKRIRGSGSISKWNESATLHECDWLTQVWASSLPDSLPVVSVLWGRILSCEEKVIWGLFGIYHVEKSRVVPDTDLAGYPANNFAGYRISGRISG